MTKLKLLGTVIVLDGAVDDGRIGGVDQAVDKAENTCCHLWGPNKKKDFLKVLGIIVLLISIRCRDRSNQFNIVEIIRHSYCVTTYFRRGIIEPSARNV